MPAAAALRVLVTDDQASIRHLIIGCLQRFGVLNVEQAMDGEEGYGKLVAAAAASKAVHLILSDFEMPKRDGLHFLQDVRNNPATAATAFIMLTGRADGDLVRKASQFRVNNFLVKPFQPIMLKTKIEDVLGPLT